MIDPNELARHLALKGFRLGWDGSIGRQFNYVFVRLAPIIGVYEQIDIDSMGRHGESVYCHVRISPVRGHCMLFKATPEIDELVVELGKDG
ncbi:MAG: hypothetical protein U0892_01475 [Pirellulales bacterium]